MNLRRSLNHNRISIERKQTIMDTIEKRLQKIETRNAKVEIDKKWETSWTRRIIITLLTYLVIVIFFFITQLPKPFINSVIPTAGFMLSTLSLPFFKTIWEKYIK